MRAMTRGVPEAGRPRKAYLLLGVAAVTCPCHLPLALALLGGTALAAVLREHAAAAFAVMTVVFAGSLLRGLRAWGEPDRGTPRTAGESRPPVAESNGVGGSPRPAA